MGKDLFRMPQPRAPQPPMVAIDRMGRPIEPGHLILFHASEDLLFEVVSVGPVLNPSVQGGRSMRMVIQANFPVEFMPAYPNRGVVVVGETQARIDAKAAANGKVAAPIGGVPKILMTDADDLTAPPDPVDDSSAHPIAVSMCDACGHTDGDVGAVCSECGSGTYIKVE